MTKNRQTLGREGENFAARYLEARGYQIIARNVRAGRVEIDLVAGAPGLIVFAEVKSRRATTGDGFGTHGRAAEAVDERKQRRIRRGALTWLEGRPDLRRRGARIRFDVLTCLLERRHADYDAPTSRAGEPEARNQTSAPREGTRWSIEHWRAAF